MVALTLSSQLEIIALGMLTQKGPELFEVFAPLENETLTPQKAITFSQIKDRWPAISDKGAAFADQKTVSQFLDNHKKKDIVSIALSKIDEIFHISNNLPSLAIFLVMVALAKALVLFAHRFTSKLLSIYVSQELRERYFIKLQSLPLKFYQKYHVGSLSSRVSQDATVISEAVNSLVVNYIQTPFTIISTLILCFITSWKLSLIIFLGMPILIFPIIFIANRVRKVARMLQKNQEKFATVLIDFLAGIQTVKLFSLEQFSLQKYQEQNAKMAQLEIKSAKYDLSSRPVVHTIAMCFLALTMLFGLYVEQMDVSEVLVYCGFLYIFYEPIKKFSEENSRVQRGVAAAERLEEVMSIKVTEESESGELLLPKKVCLIEFKDVWFKYEEEWVLKGVSFKAEPGQTVAIVGPTGSGKTTVAQLIPRLYDVTAGEICVAGQNIANYTLNSLRDAISFVPQKPFLFLDTIRENISFGQKFSDQQIKKAAKLALIDGFIDNLPQKYLTVLCEAGKNLSGGQQQRLTIARALVRQAPILILDEATSALDAVSENYIKETMLNLGKSTTKIIIAHRLTTIEHADKIIYLKAGQKIAEGSHEELIKICPEYKLLWSMSQKNSYVT